MLIERSGGHNDRWVKAMSAIRSGFEGLAQSLTDCRERQVKQEDYTQGKPAR